MLDKALKNKSRLKYVASLIDGKASVSLKEINKDQYIKFDDVEINWKEEVLTARNYQNKLIK